MTALMRRTVIEKSDNCVIDLENLVESYFSERQKNVEKAQARVRLGGHDTRGEWRKKRLHDLRDSRVQLHFSRSFVSCQIKRPLAV